MHLETSEPLRLLESAGKPTLDAVRAMGHDIVIADGIGGVMNGAEFIHDGCRTRGGSGETAAGAD